MGMYDSLFVKCPCGKEIEFQSKAGDCWLIRYTIFDAPPKVAADLAGKSKQCDCGRTVDLWTQPIIVPMFSGGPV